MYLHAAFKHKDKHIHAYVDSRCRQTGPVAVNLYLSIHLSSTSL